MTIETDIPAESLLSDPVLGSAPPRDLARLLLRVRRRAVEPGDNLFAEGDPADAVYLIETGAFAVLRHGSLPVNRASGFVGEEAAIGADAYSETVVATEPSQVLALPKAQMRELAEASPRIKDAFFRSYANRYAAADKPGRAAGKAPPAPPASRKEPFPLKAVIGWLVTIVLPVLVYRYGVAAGFGLNTIYFVCAIAAAVSMWVFELVPEFVPPLFSIVVVVLLDVAPPQVAFSGFTSNTFFLCLSVFGVGALMVGSGLTYRLSLRILAWVPASRFGYNVSLFLSGLILTPVVPSPMGRMVMVQPFCVDLVDAARAGPKDPGASQFVNATVAGVAIPASVFLTGKPANLIVLGMFDYQTQYIYQWVHWLVAGSLVGVILVVAYFVLQAIVFPRAGRFAIPKAVIGEQLRILGPLTPMEWGAVGAVAALALGIVTTAVHKVDIPWMALTVLVVLLLFGAVGRADLRTRIDWPTLIFIGTIVAWVPLMTATGLDRIITQHLGWLGDYMRKDLQTFIGLLCVLLVAARFALPGGAVTVIFATALFPVATAAGITPWLVGYVILTMSEGHILGYQNAYYLQLMDALRSSRLDDAVDQGRTVVLNVLLTAARVAAIYASVPFWRYLGVI